MIGIADGISRRWSVLATRLGSNACTSICLRPGSRTTSVFRSSSLAVAFRNTFMSTLHVNITFDNSELSHAAR